MCTSPSQILTYSLTQKSNFYSPYWHPYIHTPGHMPLSLSLFIIVFYSFTYLESRVYSETEERLCHSSLLLSGLAIIYYIETPCHMYVPRYVPT